jgi:hypothetical protein
MGEAADKMNHRDHDSHKRVVELREEIIRKREQLTEELNELRRRREDAIVMAKRGAKVAGVGVVGAMIAGSLLNAVVDLFRKDDDDDRYDDSQRYEMTTVAEERQQGARQSMVSALISALTTMAVAEIRRYAMEYARKELRSRLDMGRENFERRMAPRTGTDGEGREVA